MSEEEKPWRQTFKHVAPISPFKCKGCGSTAFRLIRYETDIIAICCDDYCGNSILLDTLPNAVKQDIEAFESTIGDKIKELQDLERKMGKVKDVKKNVHDRRSRNVAGTKDPKRV